MRFQLKRMNYMCNVHIYKIIMTACCMNKSQLSSVAFNLEEKKKALHLTLNELSLEIYKVQRVGLGICKLQIAKKIQRHPLTKVIK